MHHLAGTRLVPQRAEALKSGVGTGDSHETFSTYSGGTVFPGLAGHAGLLPLHEAGAHDRAGPLRIAQGKLVLALAPGLPRYQHTANTDN